MPESAHDTPYTDDKGPLVIHQGKSPAQQAKFLLNSMHTLA